jgi:hypothetical protein
MINFGIAVLGITSNLDLLTSFSEIVIMLSPVVQSGLACERYSAKLAGLSKQLAPLVLNGVLPGGGSTPSAVRAFSVMTQ